MFAVFDHQNATGITFTFGDNGRMTHEITGLPSLQSIARLPLNKLRQGRSRLTGLEITGLLYHGPNGSHIFVEFSTTTNVVVINTVAIINGDYAPIMRHIHAAITAAFIQD